MRDQPLKVAQGWQGGSRMTGRVSFIHSLFPTAVWIAILMMPWSEALAATITNIDQALLQRLNQKFPGKLVSLKDYALLVEDIEISDIRTNIGGLEKNVDTERYVN